jgi:uncharacterized membrane protein SpoIIM required for sporulation
MAELKLKSHRFRAEREADWARLERLMDRAETRGAKALSDADLLAVPVLYRATLSSLSVARATSLDQGVIDYLESLTTRAYFFVYGARSTLLERIARFFAQDWPNAVRSLWRETAVSAGIGVVGALVAAFLVLRDPDWYYAFLSRELASGRDPTASTEFLRKGLYEKPNASDDLASFAAFLFTHNAQIALLAFVVGFAFCAPTVLILAANGCMLGAVLALYISRGLGWQEGGWLMIHGVTELFAITLAGAAGLKIGWTLAFPGERSRVEAAGAAGRTAAVVAAGVVVMLFVAGLLEGFGRQLITDDLARYAIASASALVWGLFFYLPRRAAPPAGGRP